MIEQQNTAEDMREALHKVREEALGKINSLKIELNEQRNKINRCLDENIRIMKEMGSSSLQIAELLNGFKIKSKLGSRNHHPTVTIKSPEPIHESLPPNFRTEVSRHLPPKNNPESQDEFDQRADRAMRTAERTHHTFPLPSTTKPESPAAAHKPHQHTDPIHQAALDGRLPASPQTMFVSSASRAGRRADRDTEQRWQSATRLANSLHRAPIPVNNSISAYRAGLDRGDRIQDVMNEFSENAADLIRETIALKVGSRFDLLPNVRPPNKPVKYSGENDHDFFTVEFLEKLLAWFRAGNYGGPDLDSYRVVLLQSYLTNEAHRWFVTETETYARENNGAAPEFAEIMCALHQRFIKSSTAQHATRAFDAVKYDSAKGPEQLYTDLLDKGRKMVETPS
ncbi:hypothetical protein R3P38DRAFT_3203088 [Favolaschia claudopus]|uniref:Retrotransposon gag domain-containing protein n=1 Tax=Favolaschia claudopus TaxID=2862362 RepID=A0AAW0ASX9_9AGAR